MSLLIAALVKSSSLKLVSSPSGDHTTVSSSNKGEAANGHPPLLSSTTNHNATNEVLTQPQPPQHFMTLPPSGVLPSLRIKLSGGLPVSHTRGRLPASGCLYHELLGGTSHLASDS